MQDLSDLSDVETAEEAADIPVPYEDDRDIEVLRKELQQDLLDTKALRASTPARRAGRQASKAPSSKSGSRSGTLTPRGTSIKREGSTIATKKRKRHTSVKSSVSTYKPPKIICLENASTNGVERAIRGFVYTDEDRLREAAEDDDDEDDDCPVVVAVRR